MAVSMEETCLDTYKSKVHWGRMKKNHDIDAHWHKQYESV